MDKGKVLNFLVLLQIIYNIFITVQFAFIRSVKNCLFEFILNRSQQFIDLIFGAIIVSTTDFHEFKVNIKNSAQRLLIFITNAVYFRLITLTTVSLIVQTLDITYDDAIVIMTQYLYTLLIITFYVESFKSVMFCNIVLIFSFSVQLIQLDNLFTAFLGTSTLISLSVFIMCYTKKDLETSEVNTTIETQNKMGEILMTAFQNSLPSKILPQILKAENPPCEIVNNVNFCYMYFRPPEIQTKYGIQQQYEVYLSKINQFFCILDFFSDILDIQKIKSSHMYYMCCTGAQQQLNKDVNISEHDYPNQYDTSKLLITFCIIAQQIAEKMDINCSCGITKGDVIVGAISMSTSIINFDTYGDTINTAARIARNNVNGVFIYLDQFKEQEFNDDLKQMTEDCDDENDINLQYVDYTKFKTIFLKVAPQYYFTKAIKREYKGKGVVCVHQVQPNSQLQAYACQSFQRAYLLLATDYLQKNIQGNNELNEISHFKHDLDDSMLESSESFIDSDATSNDGEISNSNDVFVVEDSIAEDVGGESNNKQLKITRGQKLEKNIQQTTQRLINTQCLDFYPKLSQQTQNNYQYLLKNMNNVTSGSQIQYGQNQNQFYLHGTVNQNIIRERLQSFDIQRLLQPDNQPMLSISHKLKRNSSSKLKNLLGKDNPNLNQESQPLQRLKSEKFSDLKKQLKSSSSKSHQLRDLDDKSSDIYGGQTPRDREHRSNNRSEISGRSIDSGYVNPQLTARKHTFGVEQSGKVYLNKDLHAFFTIARQTNEKKFFGSRTEYTNIGGASGHDGSSNRFLRQLNEDERETQESNNMRNSSISTSITSTKNRSVTESGASKKIFSENKFPIIKEQSQEDLKSYQAPSSKSIKQFKDLTSEQSDKITDLQKLPPLDFTKLNQNSSQVGEFPKKTLQSKTLDTSQLVCMIQQKSVIPNGIDTSKMFQPSTQKIGHQRHMDQAISQTSKLGHDGLQDNNGSDENNFKQQEQQTIFQRQIVQLKQMTKFLLDYSQMFVEGIHDNQELLEIWLRNYSLKYQFYQTLQFMIYCISTYFLFIHSEYRVRVLNILFKFHEIYGNICVVMIILMLIVLFFQINYCSQVKQELAVQKKQYNHDSLDKLLNGQFSKFQQVYIILIMFLQHAKIFIDAKLIYTYKNVELFVPQQMHYTVLLILDLVMLFSLTMNHIWYQVINIQIISHSYKVIWSFFFLFAILHAFMIKIMSLVMVFSMVMLTIYTYPRMKSFYTNCAVEIQLKDQLNNGKALLKNILPQITIDALLSNSQNNDTIIIENNVYKLFKLKSIQQLLEQNNLPLFNKQLNNVVYYDEIAGLASGNILGTTGMQDGVIDGTIRQHEVTQQYYNFRLCQMIFKYSKLPNRRSFGSDRPVINFGEVAYLNLDVSQFTSFCSSHKVDQIQQLLKKLFGRFDNRMKLCKNIIQVKICGDSYELMSLPLILKQYKSKVNLDKNKLVQLKNYDAVNQLIFLGLGFIEDCKSVLQKYFPEESEKLGLRVGISFGEVLGSLLGNKITRFDTFGMVPVLAEEAQSNASRNSIMIDKSAWNVLNNNISVLKDYIIDFVTTETMKNNYANYNEEIVDFELIENEYGVGIKGIK